MRKKRVLMVCEAYTGGVFLYVTQLCNDICNEYDVFLAFSYNSVKKRRPVTPTNYRQLLDPRIHLFEIEGFGEAKSLCKTIRRLRRIVSEVQPDIIHLHSSIAGGIGRIAINGKKYKIVYTPHGYSFALMGKGIKRKLLYLAEWVLGKTEAITLVCAPSEETVAKRLTRNTACIETGINVRKIDEQLCAIEPKKNDGFTVYTLGRICYQKQPALFNKIASLVPEANFVWAGSGELERELTASNLRVTGWMPRQEALAVGKSADIYILCSLGEAIAMSLLENMYMGKLCLVSNVLGNKDVIDDGKNGYLCDSAEDYAKRIREAMSMFPKELGIQAHEDVLSVYNTERMKNEYLKFYEELCEQ